MESFDSKALDRLRSWQAFLTDTERLPFTQVLINHKGRDVYAHSTGFADVENKIPANFDTISRIYSMTKPVSSVALMMLYEQGLFQLPDPVHLYLGDRWKKKNMKVYKSGDAKSGYETVPCKRNITVKMVLTHTSGLSYGFDMFGFMNKVDEIYFHEKLLLSKGPRDEHHATLEDFVDFLPKMPLLFQPGKSWNYGYNVEVVGRLVEAISGQPFDEFMRQKILKPLKMNDTDFHVPQRKADRFAKLYMRKPAPGQKLGMVNLQPGKGPKTGLKQIKNNGIQWTEEQKFFKPGEGLVGTIHDYMKFCQMLLQGGKLGETRILSRKTIEWMTINHLDKDQDMLNLQELGGYGEVAKAGTGFGLGFSVVVDPVKTELISSVGTYSWGGAASTIFWIDPQEQLIVIFFTQLLFNDPFLMPLRAQLGSLIYGSLSDTDNTDDDRGRIRAWHSREYSPSSRL